MSQTDPTQTLYEGKFLRVRKTETWEYVERTKSSGVVVILPLTTDEKIILIEQFRVPVGRKVVALPAGLAGDEEGGASEDLITAARRELTEETGYTARDWKQLSEGPSSPGLTNEMITFFLAADASRSGAADPQGEEKIQVHEVPLARLSEWLGEKKSEGSLIDYKIFAALYLVSK